MYNYEMEAEVKRLEAHARAVNAGHPECANACVCYLRNDPRKSVEISL